MTMRERATRIRARSANDGFASPALVLDISRIRRDTISLHLFPVVRTGAISAAILHLEPAERSAAL